MNLTKSIFTISDHLTQEVDMDILSSKINVWEIYEKDSVPDIQR